MKNAALSVLLSLCALGASAEPVYRCGSAYSQTPCPQARVVDASDERSPAQREEARRVATDERRLAADMRRERLADQAALKPAMASSLSGPMRPTPRLAHHAVEHRHAKRKAIRTVVAANGDFVAVDPSAVKRRGAK